MKESTENVKILEEIEQNLSFMTKDEIENIISLVPDPSCINKRVREMTTESIKRTLRELLGREKILIHEPERTKIKASLSNFIINKIEHARLIPGEPVGPPVSLALVSGFIQDSISAFRYAGQISANTGDNILEAKRLIEMPDNNKNAMSYIFFDEDFLSYTEIYERSKDITEVNLPFLMKDQSTKYISDDLDRSWYDDFKIVERIKIDTDIFDRPFLYRIWLDKEKLFIYNISIRSIIDKLQLKLDKCTFVYSDTVKAIIDIYIDANTLDLFINLGAKDSDFSRKSKMFVAFNYYIYTIVLPILSNILVKGVRGIYSGNPEYLRVFTGIKKAKYITDRQWKIKLDDIWIKMEGLPMTRIYHILDRCGFAIEEDEEGKIIISCDEILEDIPFSTRKEMDDYPFALYNKLLKEDDQKEEDFLLEAIRGGDLKKEWKETDLQKASKYYYLVTPGSNLLNLFTRKGIDTNRTYSNNPMEMHKVLGIEATANFLMYMLTRNFKSTSQKINHQCIYTLVTYMTSLSTPTRIKSQDTQTRTENPITKGTVQSPIKSFAAAAFGSEHSASDDVSASISIGTLVNITNVYMQNAKFNNSLNMLYNTYMSGGKSKINGGELEKEIMNQFRKTGTGQNITPTIKSRFPATQTSRISNPGKMTRAIPEDVNILDEEQKRKERLLAEEAVKRMFEPTPYKTISKAEDILKKKTKDVERISSSTIEEIPSLSEEKIEKIQMYTTEEINKIKREKMDEGIHLKDNVYQPLRNLVTSNFLPDILLKIIPDIQLSKEDRENMKKKINVRAMKSKRFTIHKMESIDIFNLGLALSSITSV